MRRRVPLLLRQPLGEREVAASSTSTRASGTSATAPEAAEATVAPPLASTDQAAVGLRDELSARMKLADPRPATVVAGTNILTGESVAAASSETGCAENGVEFALGVPAGQIRFTGAVRPRTGAPVDVCPKCEYRYGREAFPGANFQSDRLPKPAAPPPPPPPPEEPHNPTSASDE